MNETKSLFIREKCETRHIGLQEIWEEGDWHFKIYYLPRPDSPDSPSIEERMLEIIKFKCRSIITRYSTHANSYGLGYIILSEESQHNYLIINWWANETRAFHFGLAAGIDRPYHYRNITSGGLTASVWETLIHFHEAQAWLKHILQKPFNYDLKDYLADIYANEKVLV
jgi:hypothetical protein